MAAYGKCLCEGSIALLWGDCIPKRLPLRLQLRLPLRPRLRSRLRHLLLQLHLHLLPLPLPLPLPNHPASIVHFSSSRLPYGSEQFVPGAGPGAGAGAAGRCRVRSAGCGVPRAKYRGAY